METSGGFFDTGYAIGAVASLGMVLYNLPYLRRAGWGDRGRQALCGAFFFSFIGQITEVSMIAAPLNEFFGVPNFNRLVAYICANLVGVCEALLVSYWVMEVRAPVRLTRRLVFSGICLFGLIATFAGGDQVSATQFFAIDHAHSPYVASFLLFYAIVQVSYLGDVARVSWRLSGMAQRTWMRRGLRLVAVGGIIGVLDAFVIAAFVAIALSGGTAKDGEGLSALLVMIASLFLLSGFAIPSLEPRLESARDWLARYRSHRALYPLWRAFYEVIPEIALDPPKNRWRAVWSPYDLKFRALRRVIEIRDGKLSIGPYIDPDVARIARTVGAAQGLRDQDLEAVVEAAQIKAGLRALTGDKPLHDAAEVFIAPAFEDITAEMRRLSRVARAFTKPIAAPTFSHDTSCRSTLPLCPITAGYKFERS